MYYEVQYETGYGEYGSIIIKAKNIEDVLARLDEIFKLKINIKSISKNS